MTHLIQTIARSLEAGAVIPYLGPDMLSLCTDVKVPSTPLALAESMTAKVSVPHKIRKRLTQAAQFIENFKHRKSVVHLMNEAFAEQTTPSPLHLALAASGAGLWVDTWYDDTFAAALAQVPGRWVQIQGLSQSEHFGQFGISACAPIDLQRWWPQATDRRLPGVGSGGYCPDRNR